MRTLLLFCLAFLPTLLFCQRSPGLRLEGIVGLRLQLNEEEGPGYSQPFKIYSVPGIGLKLSHARYPFALLYQYNFQPSANIPRVDSNNIGTLSQIINGRLIMGYYSKRQWLFGLGHYREKTENEIDFLLPENIKYTQNIVLAAGFKQGPFEIEWQYQLRYYLVFETRRLYLHSLNVRYMLSRRQADQKQYSFKNLGFNALVGGRAFLIRQEKIEGEHYPSPIGVALHFGLELSFKKINTSLNLERDIWVSVNGGSFQRELKGLVVNSIVGVRYHWKLKNEKRLRFGLGVAFITDHNTLYELRANPTRDFGLYHYNIRGISASVAYSIAKRWDVEIRHIKPHRGETGYNAQRTSVGIIRRLSLETFCIPQNLLHLCGSITFGEGEDNAGQSVSFLLALTDNSGFRLWRTNINCLPSAKA